MGYYDDKSIIMSGKEIDVKKLGLVGLILNGIFGARFRRWSYKYSPEGLDEYSQKAYEKWQRDDMVAWSKRKEFEKEGE